MKWSEVKLLSRVWLFATPWTAACQAPQSMEFSRQEYWSGLPFPSPGDLPNQSIYLFPCCCQAVRRSEQFSTSEMCLKAQTSPVQKVTFSLHLVFQNYWGWEGGRSSQLHSLLVRIYLSVWFPGNVPWRRWGHGLGGILWEHLRCSTYAPSLCEFVMLSRVAVACPPWWWSTGGISGCTVRQKSTVPKAPQLQQDCSYSAGSLWVRWRILQGLVGRGESRGR